MLLNAENGYAISVDLNVHWKLSGISFFPKDTYSHFFPKAGTSVEGNPEAELINHAYGSETTSADYEESELLFDL